MPQPTVLDGMRAPRSVRLEEIRSAQPDPAGTHPVSVAAAPEGVTVYVSKYRRYRVQITAPQSYIGPDGRKNTGGKRLEAQFEDGVYRNDARDPATRKLIDETLQANRYFGPFGSMADFWLASDQQEKTDAKRLQSALDTLKSLPRETVKEYVQQLQHGSAEDHTLPAEPAKGARPIPPTPSAE